MTYRTVATASAIVSAFYGLAALIAPEALATLYGMTLDAVARYAARLLGGSYLGYAILNFLTKDTADPLTRRALSAANAFGWAVSCVVTVFGQMQGLANLGWAPWSFSSPSRLPGAGATLRSGRSGARISRTTP